MSLKLMEVVLLMEHLFPQEGQKRLWQRKGTNLRLPQLVQPPKEGLPQPSILLTLSMIVWRG